AKLDGGVTGISSRRLSLLLRSISSLGECPPRFGDLAGCDRRRGIAPGAANIAENGGRLIVRQQPGELWPRRARWRACRGGAARPPQHHVQQRRSVGLLNDRGSIERRKEARCPLPVRAMAARAFVSVDGGSHLHNFFVRLNP